MQLKDIEQRIRELSPAFGAGPKDQRFQYAHMLQDFFTNKRKHKSGPDALSFSYRYLEKHFGRGGFERINAIADCMIASNSWNYKDHETRCYWLTSKGKEIVEEAILEAAESSENEIVQADGSPLRHRKNGIVSRDKKGSVAKTQAKIKWAVEVNLDAIDHAIEKACEHEE